MEEIWRDKQAAILGVGIALHEWGMNEWALTRPQALHALDLLAAEGMAVLGGDVWVMEGSNPCHYGDGWHCDRKRGETGAAFVARSIAVTRDFIAPYPAIAPEPLFAFVIGSLLDLLLDT